MAVVAASSLSKRYGDTEALRDASLRVESGEVLGLIGPNGAGKTTLMRCLTGVVPPTSGEVTLFDSPPEAAANKRIGYLPQSFEPPSRLTVTELVRYYAHLYDNPRPTSDVVADVGLQDRSDSRYARLSGGERRRTLVATTLVHSPDALFLDEPTTGIDPEGRRAVWRLLEALAETGVTIVVTSHSMQEIDRLADRIVVMNDGRLVADDTPRGLVSSHGGANRLLIETSDTDAVSLTDYRTERVEGGVLVYGVESTDLRILLGELESAGVSLSGLTWRKPGLEEVYLDLTGGAASGEQARSGRSR